MVQVNDGLALLQVGLGSHVLHVVDGLGCGQDGCQSEEGGLKHSVLDLGVTQITSQLGSVDDVELDVVLSDILLHSGRQVGIQLLDGPVAVQQEGTVGLNILHDVVAGDVSLVVASHEVSLIDVVRRLDGGVTEAQVGDGDTVGLLGVILEVSLNVLVSMVTDDLDGVLVRTDGTVAAQTPELAGLGAGRSGVGSHSLLEGAVGHVVYDTNGEVRLGLVLGQVCEDREDGGRRSILGAQTVAAADDLLLDTVSSQSGNVVEVQRLTQGAGLLGTVEDSDLLAGCGNGLDELVGAEGTVQADLDQTDLLTLSQHIVDDLLCHVADGAHSDHDAVCVGSAVVVEELVVGAQLDVDLVHVLLDDGGQSVVVAVAGLAVLEEDITVLSGAAEHRMLGVQSAGAESGHSVHIHHLSQISEVPDLDLLDLVRGTEAVEEVQEGNAALDGSEVSHSTQIHDFLGVGLSQHSETGLTASVDVGVIAEDIQSVRSHATGGHVEDAGEKLTGDLVHVGDHEEQTLGCGVGGGQRTCVQGAVDSTGGACLGFHLHHVDGGTEDVLESLCRPLVYPVSHGAGRGNRVNAGDFGESIAYRSGCLVTVHGHFFSDDCHFRKFLLENFSPWEQNHGTNLLTIYHTILF